MEIDILWRIGCKMNPFEFGAWNITTEELMGSKIIIIENYFKHPDLIRNLAINPLPELWRADLEGTMNGVHYMDRRSQLKLVGKNDEQFSKHYDYLGQLINQRAGLHSQNKSFVSNVTRFLKTSFNNIDDNYWWPHRDRGYNAIISLNNEFDGEYSGTVLYHPKGKQPKAPESTNPWVSKSEYTILKHLKAKYNRCVMFDGKIFPHAMHIDNYDFFSNFYRVNTVLFFE